MTRLSILTTIVACLASTLQASVIPVTKHGFDSSRGRRSIVERDTSGAGALRRSNAEFGKVIKANTELRILGIGDSITVGFPGRIEGGDGNGYRKQLVKDLTGNNVNLAGAVTANGTMSDNYFAAWSGKTIKYMSDHIGPSLKQQPNIILLHAGTNDMNPNPWVSTEGNEPGAAADRLGALIDQINTACPNAVVLVAMIINTCDPAQAPQTKQYQALIPGVVAKRRAAGRSVLAVDFTSFPESSLRDCIHPTNKGYDLLGDYWYDFITQIPKEWINAPVGSDPIRTVSINESSR